MKKLIIIVAWLVAFLWTGYAMAQDYESERYYNASFPPDEPTTTGQEYWVDGTNGDDANLGTSLVEAWATMSKAMNRNTDRTSGGNGGIIWVAPGIYRERWAIPKGNEWTMGTSDATRIYVVGLQTGGDGSGTVIFDSGCTADSWSVYSGSIYSTTLTQPTDSDADADGVEGVYIDGDMYSYHDVEALVDVAAEGDWFFDTGTNTLYLWVLSAKGTPSDDDVVIVNSGSSSSQDYTVRVQDHATDPADYVTLQNLTVRGSEAHGIEIGTIGSGISNIEVKFCVAYANARGGINSWTSDSCLIEKNYVYHNIMRNWPRGNWNSNCNSIGAGGWPQALGGPKNTNQEVTGNIVTDNGGEGIGGSQATGVHICHDNIVVNNWSVGIYYDNNPDNSIYSNLVYVDRTFTTDDVGWHCADGQPSCSGDACIERILKRAHQQGIMTADEYYSPGGASSQDNKIYNNLIVNCKDGIGHFYSEDDSGLIGLRCYNNTIIVPNIDPSLIGLNSYRGFAFRGDVDDSDSLIYNNIVISMHATNILVRHSNAVSAGTTFDYNTWYAPNATDGKPFEFGAGLRDTWANWKTDTGWGSNGVNADPDLQDISDPTDPDGFRPDTGSISLSGGSNLGSPYNIDYNYIARPQGAGWSMGAFETVDSAASIVGAIQGAFGSFSGSFK